MAFGRCGWHTRCEYGTTNGEETRFAVYDMLHATLTSAATNSILYSHIITHLILYTIQL
jgi:hypothetical protein